MATVFLSYDHDDVERAAPIAAALEKAGHSVWWDRHIQGGAKYNDEIEAAVEAADAVVVLWSQGSVRSTWVRDEAAEGRDQNKLVPVLLDMVKPPMGFRQFQTIDLTKAGRNPNANSMQQVLTAIDRVIGERIAPNSDIRGAVIGPARRVSRNARLVLVAALGLAAIAVAYFLLKQGGSSSPPIVAVVAADDSQGTRSITDDLFIKLGSLQSKDADALQLVEQDSDADPDLTFRVAQQTMDGQAQATVALLAGDGSLLWSREFRQGKQPVADLRQQLAYSAASVLTCATDAMAPGHAKVEQVTLKLYLSGCARLSDGSSPDTRPLVPIFTKVTEQATDFEGGWAKLLIVETQSWLQSNKDAVIGKSLKAHIAKARKVNPTMAEAYVAESWMQPIWRINHWMPISEAAVAKNPSNAYALTEHSNDMFWVGRLQQGVTYARDAVQADPLSPWVRDSLIIALINAGEIEAAYKALEDAERLWPGATNLIDGRFYLTARYGDPRQALALLRSGMVSRQNMSPAMESYLEARIDPSPAKIERAVSQARDVSRRWYLHYIETLGQFRRKEELIKSLSQYDPGKNLGPAHVFQPRYGFLQDDVRFMEIMNRWGSQLDYWIKSGNWPDFCSRPGLPYDCKVVAAKLPRSARRRS